VVQIERLCPVGRVRGKNARREGLSSGGGQNEGGLLNCCRWNSWSHVQAIFPRSPMCTALIKPNTSLGMPNNRQIFVTVLVHSHCKLVCKYSINIRDDNHAGTLGPSQFLDDGVGVLFRCRLTAQVPCNGRPLGNCLKRYDILILNTE